MSPFLAVWEDKFSDRDYHDSTLLHPLGLTALLVLALLVLVLPRRWATFPVLLLAVMIPSAQRVSLAGLDLTLLRLIVLAGWARMLIRGEWRAIRFCKPDKIICLWAAVEATAYILLHRNSGAFIYMSARMYEGLGIYFLFRGLVRDWGDVRQVAFQLFLISVPTGLAFLYENSTRHNLFSIFGGVPAVTPIREGRLRCFGAFDNPIVAGCFFAAVMPLIASAWWWRGGRYRPAAAVGVAFCLVVVVACASSTPVAAVGAALLGALLFKLRWWMSELRRGLVATLVLLHLVMDRPVWHLLARIDIVGGSTGWHRFNLLDQAIRHVHEWALIGVKGTGHWGVQLFDLTNQYVLEGVYGGLGALWFFIAILVCGYRGVGYLWRAAGRDRERLALAWALGTGLFVHTMCFIAVSYFGQIIVAWYMLPAMIASLAEPFWLGQRAGVPQGANEEALFPGQRVLAGRAAALPDGLPRRAGPARGPAPRPRPGYIAARRRVNQPRPDPDEEEL